MLDTSTELKYRALEFTLEKRKRGMRHSHAFENRLGRAEKGIQVLLFCVGGKK